VKTRTIRGEEYALVVLRVVDWDAEGRPRTVVVGYDDSTFKLSENRFENEFFTCFVPIAMTKSKGAAN
jgi:hypothetical protein